MIEIINTKYCRITSNSQKGIAHIFVIIILLFLLTGVLAWVFMNSKNSPQDQSVDSRLGKGLNQTPTITPDSKIPVSGSGVPFGPFHLPEDMFESRFTGAFVSLRPQKAEEVLDQARKANISILVNLAGGRSSFQNEDGSFSLEKFQARIDQYKDVDLDSYVEDGTLIGHLMFDEPQDPSNWNGSVVSFADIDEAAKYSEEFWPNMPTGVGGPPSFLKNYSWNYLDFGFAQYISKKGNVETWKNSEVTAAKSAGLGLAISINVLGGNNQTEVSAAQLKDWGEILANEAYICALLMWKYDKSYFGSSDIVSSVEDLVEITNSHAPTSCRP